MNLRDARVVFWDFDGVIKESVAVKADAFHALFLPHGRELAERVRAHHLAHGGISRYEKLPVYLEWVGQPAGEDTVAEYARRYSQLVEDAVVAADWVPGARDALAARRDGQAFVLVSATPEAELRRILKRLGVLDRFARVVGSPTPKHQGIRESLVRLGAEPDTALMIGDSPEDRAAAERCGIAFLLRRTPENRRTMPDYNGAAVENFA